MPTARRLRMLVIDVSLGTVRALHARLNDRLTAEPMLIEHQQSLRRVEQQLWARCSFVRSRWRLVGLTGEAACSGVGVNVDVLPRPARCDTRWSAAERVLSWLRTDLSMSIPAILWSQFDPPRQEHALLLHSDSNAVVWFKRPFRLEEMFDELCRMSRAYSEVTDSCSLSTDPLAAMDADYRNDFRRAAAALSDQYRQIAGELRDAAAGLLNRHPKPLLDLLLSAAWCDFTAQVNELEMCSWRALDTTRLTRLLSTKVRGLGCFPEWWKAYASTEIPESDLEEYRDMAWVINGQIAWLSTVAS